MRIGYCADATPTAMLVAEENSTAAQIPIAEALFADSGEQPKHLAEQLPTRLVHTV